MNTFFTYIPNLPGENCQFNEVTEAVHYSNYSFLFKKDFAKSNNAV